jgi:hypothetical protein
MVIKSRRMNWARVIGQLRVTYKVPVETDHVGDLTISGNTILNEKYRE